MDSPALLMAMQNFDHHTKSGDEFDSNFFGINFARTPINRYFISDSEYQLV